MLKKKDSKIELRVSAEEKEKIREIAEKEGLKISQYILKCLRSCSPS